MNRQIRTPDTKKLKTEHFDENDNDCPNNNNENELEILEKISNACTNLSKSEWLETYNLRLKDIREIRCTRNAVDFFKKWALFKNSSIYVLWDFQKLAGSVENKLSEEWEKFYVVAPDYINENIKDRKIKAEMAKLLTELSTEKNSEYVQFTGKIFLLDLKLFNVNL